MSSTVQATSAPQTDEGTDDRKPDEGCNVCLCHLKPGLQRQCAAPCSKGRQFNGQRVGRPLQNCRQSLYLLQACIEIAMHDRLGGRFSGRLSYK